MMESLKDLIKIPEKKQGVAHRFQDVALQAIKDLKIDKKEQGIMFRHAKKGIDNFNRKVEIVKFKVLEGVEAVNKD